ncbi:MAG: TRAM domain-containing protein [Phycisphaerae bacterium]
MILLQVSRALFVLAVVAVGWSLVEAGNLLPDNRVYLVLGSIVLAGAIIALDVLQPRKNLNALAGLFFGLVVGLVISYGISLVLDYLRSVYLPTMDRGVMTVAQVFVGLICCYLCVSFIMQTKDDIRFVIPYVQFARQVKGQRPIIVDTSVIIDGRIADIAETGFLDNKLVVPRFVLNELHAVADSTDRIKRNRGRRGLDVLNRLRACRLVDIEITETDTAGDESVDHRLVALAAELSGRLVTNDYNLNKVAQLRGVPVINLNDLAKAIRTVVLPGEALSVKVLRPGEEANQGVGYLDDGTMVVVDQGRGRIGDVVDCTVTSVLQTSAGRMIFAQLAGAGPGAAGRPRAANHATG